MNLHVTRCAVGILSVLIMLRTGRLDGSDVMGHAVAGQTQLIDGAISQQPRIRRAVRRMAGRASFGFHRSMFIRERPLLVRVTLNTRCIRSGGQSCLFEFKTAVRVMAITAAHCAFQDFVMEGRGEGRLDLAMTTQAKLRVVHLQHFDA